MRIAEVVSKFPPFHGGMGYVCYHNSLELSRLGHEVTVFTLDYKRLEHTNEPSEFKVVRLKTPFKYGDGGIAPQLYWSLREFDVIHLHYPFYGSNEYVYLASALRGQKYFLTYHMDVFGTTPLKRAIIGAYDLLLTRRIINGASLLGALSVEHLKSTKASSFIDWPRVVVLPNGVDAEKFRPRVKDHALLEKYDLKDKTVALFVGNILQCKGLHVLLDAFSRINDDTLALIVVGGGYEENKCRIQTGELGLTSRVIFAGHKTSDDLPGYYSLADFLVLPSVLSEAFPLVVLEAMASGIPVIVTDLPGPSSIVSEGIDGFVVRAGDVSDLSEKVMLMAGNMELRISMGQRAREKALHSYSWPEIGKKLEGILQGIAPGK